MRSNERFTFPWLVAGFFAICAVFSSLPAAAQSSAIEGSWKLVSRVLPDGKLGSFSALAAYRLTADEYTESRLFRVFDDPSSGKGVDYETVGAVRAEPMKQTGQQIRIKAPFDPVTWIFEGSKLTAIAAGGEFVDNWARVK